MTRQASAPGPSRDRSPRYPTPIEPLFIESNGIPFDDEASNVCKALIMYLPSPTRGLHSLLLELNLSNFKNPWVKLGVTVTIRAQVELKGGTSVSPWALPALAPWAASV